MKNKFKYIILTSFLLASINIFASGNASDNTNASFTTVNTAPVISVTISQSITPVSTSVTTTTTTSTTGETSTTTSTEGGTATDGAATDGTATEGESSDSSSSETVNPNIVPGISGATAVVVGKIAAFCNIIEGGSPATTATNVDTKGILSSPVGGRAANGGTTTNGSSENGENGKDNGHY